MNAQLKLTKTFLYSGGGSYSKPGNYYLFSNRERNRRDGESFKRYSSVSLNRKASRILTLTEISEKRQKGLCFFYDEKFLASHRYNSKSKCTTCVYVQVKVYNLGLWLVQDIQPRSKARSECSI